MAIERVSSVRISPDNTTVLNNLGCLQEFAGAWRGEGFNLIARPDFEDKTNLYLQLNQTYETLNVDPIGSPIPNRGFGQDDINLFGLTYLQKISDAATGGALHIEPGIWITQPGTTYPLETAPPPGQIVARMGTIPHGNSLLAQGICEPFNGPPTLTPLTGGYAFSQFPSFNSTPFGVPPPPPAQLPPLPPVPPVINAAGSSEKLTAPPKPPFIQYDLTNAAGPIVIGGVNVLNTRTPYGTSEPPLPASIKGVPMQEVVNDPIKLLQAVITQQVANGHTFEGTVINIATQASISFAKNANNTPAAPPVVISPTNGAGGIENILFLEGGENPAEANGPNADTATVYATFWIEKVMHKDYPTFMQLQYAQMVVLNFAILAALPNVVMIGWPHISVATLRKTFN